MNKVWILVLCALSSMQLNASHDELVDILSIDSDNHTSSILYGNTIEGDRFQNPKEMPAAPFSFPTPVNYDKNERMIPRAKKPMKMEMKMKNKNCENERWANRYTRVIHYWSRDYRSSEEALTALFAVSDFEVFKANRNLYNDDEPTSD